jgi:hypothetical protein
MSAACPWSLSARSRHDDVTKAIGYFLKFWASFTDFLEDRKICMTNNAAERGLRKIALGLKSWPFVGSDRGGHRATTKYSLIIGAKISDVDTQGKRYGGGT